MNNTYNKFLKIFYTHKKKIHQKFYSYSQIDILKIYQKFCYIYFF